MPLKVAVLGSTGSVGRQVLEVLKSQSFEVVALSAHKNEKLLLRQQQEFRVKYIALTSRKDTDKKYISGKHWYEMLIEQSDADIVIVALLGFAGLLPSHYALTKGKRLLLANKEAIVAGGKILSDLARQTNNPIIPIDSEHSAIFQCLMGEKPEFIRKIYLTASGGPFLHTKISDFKHISPQDALAHPVWNMGAKISIDSATMMNKGLEAIEAHWLFGLKPDQIDFLIHPQAIIHSLVEFTDGSIKAQMGEPDMKTPIRFALSHPNRFEIPQAQFNLYKIADLHFEKMDYSKFPAVKLAINTLKTGGNAPCILNAANEAAVNAFLQQQISFTDITRLVEQALQEISFEQNPNLEHLIETHTETINYINKKINQ